MNDETKHSELNQSLRDSFRALGTTIRAAYELAPFAVIVAGLLAASIIWLTLLWSPLMIGTAILLVLVVSLFVFAVRGNFSEALFSLVGGLLTVFTVDWTPSNYVAFSATWVIFALAALLISSVKIAAKVQEIYKQAAIRLVGAGAELVSMEKRLKEIGSTTPLKMLGPIERAEIIRILAYRKLPIDLYEHFLISAEILSVATDYDYKSVTIILADILHSFTLNSDSEASATFDMLTRVITECPVQADEFFSAFMSSRRLILSRVATPQKFLETLGKCLAEGVPPSEIYAEMLSRLNHV